MAAIFCVVKSASESCVCQCRPQVSILHLPCLIHQVLFVTYGVGICGTHSQHVVCIKLLKDIQILLASDKCEHSLVLCKLQTRLYLIVYFGVQKWMFVCTMKYALVCKMNVVCNMKYVLVCKMNVCTYYEICFGVRNVCLYVLWIMRWCAVMNSTTQLSRHCNMHKLPKL